MRVQEGEDAKALDADLERVYRRLRLGCAVRKRKWKDAGNV